MSSEFLLNWIWLAMFGTGYKSLQSKNTALWIQAHCKDGTSMWTLYLELFQDYLISFDKANEAM